MTSRLGSPEIKLITRAKAGTVKHHRQKTLRHEINILFAIKLWPSAKQRGMPIR